MIGTVATRPVAMPVAVVAWQQLAEGSYEIVVGSSAELHEGKSGRSVRREHRAQTVTALGAEITHIGRQVDDPPAAGVDAKSDRFHGGRLLDSTRKHLLQTGDDPVVFGLDLRTETGDDLTLGIDEELLEVP